MGVLITLRCTGHECGKKNQCERYLAPIVPGLVQSLMSPPRGECPEFWERRVIAQAPRPKEDEKGAVSRYTIWGEKEGEA